MKHLGGVRRLSWELLDALRHAGVDVAVDRKLDRSPLAVNSDEPSTLRRLDLQLRSAAQELKSDGACVAHALYYDPTSFAVRGPLVVTVYDMIHERYGTGSGLLRRTKRRVVERADAIVAISQATADDMTTHFPLAAPVTVIHPAISATMLEQPPADPRGGGVLFVGHRLRHKNFRLVLDAYRRRPDLRQRPLTLVGGTSTTADERDQLGAIIGALVVHHLGVTDSLLASLYDQAAVTVVPSLWEGFGLPIIEAMARGCPVACSAVGSMAEIASGHAQLFDPTAPDACADAIMAAATSDSDAIDAARRHAARFNWDATARAHRDLYAALAG